MNRSVLIIIIAFFPWAYIYGQDLSTYLWKPPTRAGDKPVLDFDAIEQWPSLSNYRAISNDGLWVSYQLRNIPYKSSTLVIESITERGKKHEWVGGRPGVFSNNNQWYIFQKGDSICLQPLGTYNNKIQYIAGTTSFSFDQPKQPSWLAWQQKTDKRVLLQSLSGDIRLAWDSVVSYTFSAAGRWFCCRMQDKSLKLYDFSTKTQQQYASVTDYIFDESEQVLVLKTNTTAGENLQWVNLRDKKPAITYIALQQAVYKGSIASMSLDKAGRQLVFTLEEQGGAEVLYSIWYYKPGMAQPVKKVPVDIRSKEGLFIENQISFTDDGRYICFSVKARPESRKPSPELAEVDIWHYDDPFIQSAQLSWDDAKAALAPQPYLTLLEVETDRLVYLGGKHLVANAYMVRGDYALVKRFVPGDRYEQWIRRSDSVWVVSLRDGQRRFLRKTESPITFSPNGRYLLHFNEEDGQYHSYDLTNSHWANISIGIPVYLGDENPYDSPDQKTNIRTGIAGWMKDGERVLIYDSYDIWLLDLKGLKKPINVTGGFGRREGIRLRLTAEWWTNKFDFQYNTYTDLTERSDLLLTGFKWATKENGYYRKILGKTDSPEVLSQGGYITDITSSPFMFPVKSTSGRGMLPPLRARDAQVWIVCREAEQGIGYYVSNDLRNFRKLTFLQPHKQYNWYTTELVSFSQADSSMSQGILYKPENFDPSKKYPVIIHYYWQLTQNMHNYDLPYYMNSAWINIAWFVSRGYLVFTPDIYFTKATTSASALNTVEGAAIHLSHLPYVDSLRLGIAGHSRAGGYTNYILTHSRRFAAVFEGAGTSDWISDPLTLTHFASVARNTYSRSDLLNDLVKNDENPILHINTITSPLLIFHCKTDDAVPWEQGVGLYLAMRMQNKKVWMLQYDKGAHSLVVTPKKDQQDMTVRVTQFFDHYLRDAPAPVWMTQGIPASLKGIEHGLEEDKNSQIP